VATQGGKDLKGPQEQPKPPIQPKSCVESHRASIFAKNESYKMNLFAQRKKTVGNRGDCCDVLANTAKVSGFGMVAAEN
jgi:hypothetical protein